MQSLLSKYNAVVHGFEFVDPNDCVGKTMTLRRTPGGTSEVAVLIEEEARGFDPREIVIKRADGVHVQIPATSSFWEQLQYTLLNHFITRIPALESCWSDNDIEYID